MHGAQLKCPYAAGAGRLAVTSNEISLQDQLWATAGDSNNMLNVQFEGICGHPNFTGQAPPPCKSVIFLGRWQNVGTTMVQEQRALVKESFTTCNPKPNVAVPKLTVFNGSGGKGKDEHSTLSIIDAKWSDKSGGEIKCLMYGVSEVYLCINLSSSAPGKVITVKYLDYNSVESDTILKTINYTIRDSGLQQLCPVSFNVADFVKTDEDDVADYIFEITLNGKHYKPVKVLKVHAVIYIPEVMEGFGWQYAAKSQRDWFNGVQNTYPWEAQPAINNFKLDWALSFKRVKSVYDKHIEDWNSDKAISLLNARIRIMIADQHAKLPTPKNPRTTFGSFSSEIVAVMRDHKEADSNKAIEYMPLFEKYYLQSAPFSESKFEIMDDFYGSIANCNIRFAAMGTLTYGTNGRYGGRSKESGCI